MALSRHQREVAELLGSLVRDAAGMNLGDDPLDPHAVAHATALAAYLGLANELAGKWRKPGFPTAEFTNLAEVRLASTAMDAYLAALSKGDT
jgi:hypothetical protein